MKLIHQPFALIAMGLLCFRPTAHAAPPATNATPRPQPERWLLIVDTSAAMERRAKAVEGVVGELLVSGMNGQMSPGAELGIWTYNKELAAGVAPMQTWATAHTNIIAGRTVGFLSRQTYRGKPKVQNVMDELARVVSDSRQLTVVWFSDGAHNLTNTPFDAAINTAYTNYRPALAKTRMPLVTVLRAHHGKYIGQNISVAPWPVEFPPFPVEPGKTNAPAKPEIALAKPVEPAKSFYMGGGTKKIEPVVMKGGSIQLRPPPASEVAEVVTPSKPVELVPPLPITVAEPAPVVAPIEPAAMVKPAEPKPVEVAAADPLPAVPSASAGAPKIFPAKPNPVSMPPPVAVATDTVTARKWPLILGIGCMWAAIVAALVLARRARRAHATSLITRSFDRDQK